MIRKDPKVKVKVRLYYLDWTVVSYYLQKCTRDVSGAVEIPQESTGQCKVPSQWKQPHNSTKAQHTSNAQPTNTAAGSTSRPSQKTTSTQVGNISVEQYATELGVQEDHLIEALEQTFGPQQPREPPAEKMVEPQ